MGDQTCRRDEGRSHLPECHAQPTWQFGPSRQPLFQETCVYFSCVSSRESLEFQNYDVQQVFKRPMGLARAENILPGN